MISGRIGKHGKFRLWRNVGHSSLCEIGGDETTGIKNLVLEVMIPRGARALYALLGMQYLASEHEAVEMDALNNKLSILSTDEDYLVGGFDAVCVGLPEPYERAAMAGFRKALIEEERAEVERLKIFYAAYGEASSNEQVFEKAGFILAKLVSGTGSDDVEASINSMFETSVN